MGLFGRKKVWLRSRRVPAAPRDPVCGTSHLGCDGSEIASRITRPELRFVERSVNEVDGFPPLVVNGSQRTSEGANVLHKRNTKISLRGAGPGVAGRNGS